MKRNINVKIPQIIFDMIQEQADTLGLNKTAYLTHLVLQEKTRLENVERSNKVMEFASKSMDKMSPDMLMQLVKNGFQDVED